MDESQLRQVRRFNRLVTQRVGALETNYLRRGRPLAEARLIFEIGADGVDLRTLRVRLGLDSGYLSRLMQSLKTQGLITVAKDDGDGRRRRVSLTRKGDVERAAYDRLSDRLAASMLEALDEAERGRLATAMGEVERLIRAASVEVAVEAPDSADARRCLDAYFRELAARFEGGFDPEQARLARRRRHGAAVGSVRARAARRRSGRVRRPQAHRQGDGRDQAGLDRARRPAAWALRAGCFERSKPRRATWAYGRFASTPTGR